MDSVLTFDEALEQIKAEGVKEKETIECAEKTAEVINKLVAARIESGMTQRELAKKCGMKQAAIARIESFQVVPRLDTLVRIANCLGVVIDVVEHRDPIYIVSFLGESHSNNAEVNEVLNYQVNKQRLSYALLTGD